MTEKPTKAAKATEPVDNHVAAELRESFGKGAARKLRAVGRIPAVIYGHGTKPQHVSLPSHEISLILRKANAILSLDVAGKKQLALVKDVQKDPVRQIIEHLDLVIVKKGEKVHVEVPVHLVGDSFSGTIAMLDVNTLRLEVEATQIPERISIDIEGAEEGTQILAGGIALPEGSALLDAADLLIVNIVLPAAADLGEPVEALEGEAPAAAAESAEPEAEAAAEAPAE